MNLVDQLMANSEWRGECLVWTGTRTGFGYGRLYTAGRSHDVHRLAWAEHHGSIPDGLFVLHRCDNPPCWKIEHLFLGTHKDNMADMAAKGRGNHGRETHCPANHMYDEANTYVDPIGRRYCRACNRAAVAAYQKRKALLSGHA